MMIFTAYRNYPFPVPARVKFFNILRYPFSFSVLEKFLLRRLQGRKNKFWKRFIPPLYFYRANSIRDVVRHGIRLHLDISKLLDHALYFHNDKDLAWERLFTLLKPDFHVIDGGANIGFLSLMFAQRCPEGFVYAFEPDSDTFSFLSRNVDLNNHSNVKCFRLGLGRQKGTGRLYKIYRQNPGANRILNSSPANELPSEVVEVVALDELHETGAFKKINLIKLDIEGFELHALYGARKVIKLFRPILFIELVDENLNEQNCTAIEVLDLLRQMNYHVYDAKNMKPLPKSEQYYTDLVCLPRNE